LEIISTIALVVEVFPLVPDIQIILRFWERMDIARG